MCGRAPDDGQGSLTQPDACAGISAAFALHAEPQRTIFIGDIHGCCAEFEALLQAVEFAPGRDRLLLTGDAFTRGPDPLGVWQAIRASGAEMVLGNHETSLLPRLQAIAAGGPPDALKQSRGLGLRELLPHTAELVAWLERLPLAIDEPRFLLVHAGINPDTGLAGSTPDELVYIRTWPPTGGIEGPRWHDHLAPGGNADRIRPRRPPSGLVVNRARPAPAPAPAPTSSAWTAPASSAATSAPTSWKKTASSKSPPTAPGSAPDSTTEGLNREHSPRHQHYPPVAVLRCSSRASLYQGGSEREPNRTVRELRQGSPSSV